jgi:hypothetical protein
MKRKQPTNASETMYDNEARSKEQKQVVVETLASHPGNFWVWNNNAYVGNSINGQVMNRKEIAIIKGQFSAVPSVDGETKYPTAPIFDGLTEDYVWTAANFPQ